MKIFRHSMFFACLFVLIFASHASANNLVDVTPSDEEMQQLRSEIVAEYIAKNPDAVLEIPYTAEQMEEALREKNAIINEVNNKTDGNALNTTNVITATYLNIGTNATYYGGNTGYAYASDVLARTKAHWGTSGSGWIDAKSDYQSPGGSGSGYALGSIGRQVSITGTGSGTASVNIKGTYNGTLQVAGALGNNLVGTNAYASVDVEIYEVNVSTGALTKLQGSTVFSRGFAISLLPNNFGGNISTTFSTNLQAGKTYLFRISAYTKAKMPWYDVFNWATSDMHSELSGASGGQGVDFTSTQITWL